MLAALSVKVGGTLDGQVIRLCGTRCPDDLPGISVDQLGDLRPCILYGFLSFPAEDMGS